MTPQKWKRYGPRRFVISSGAGTEQEIEAKSIDEAFKQYRKQNNLMLDEMEGYELKVPIPKREEPKE